MKERPERTVLAGYMRTMTSSEPLLRWAFDQGLSNIGLTLETHHGPIPAHLAESERTGDIVAASGNISYTLDYLQSKPNTPTVSTQRPFLTMPTDVYELLSEQYEAVMQTPTPPYVHPEPSSSKHEHEIMSYVDAFRHELDTIAYAVHDYGKNSVTGFEHYKSNTNTTVYPNSVFVLVENTANVLDALNFFHAQGEFDVAHVRDDPLTGEVKRINLGFEADKSDQMTHEDRASLTFAIHQAINTMIGSNYDPYLENKISRQIYRDYRSNGLNPQYCNMHPLLECDISLIPYERDDEIRIHARFTTE